VRLYPSDACKLAPCPKSNENDPGPCVRAHPRMVIAYDSTCSYHGSDLGITSENSSQPCGLAPLICYLIAAMAETAPCRLGCYVLCILLIVSRTAGIPRQVASAFAKLPCGCTSILASAGPRLPIRYFVFGSTQTKYISPVIFVVKYVIYNNDAVYVPDTAQQFFISPWHFK